MIVVIKRQSILVQRVCQITQFTKIKKRRKRYLVRHKINENWENPITPGSLSKYILWGRYTSIDKNINHFKNKFKLK